MQNRLIPRAHWCNMAAVSHRRNTKPWEYAGKKPNSARYASWPAHKKNIRISSFQFGKRSPTENAKPIWITFFAVIRLAKWISLGYRIKYLSHFSIGSLACIMPSTEWLGSAPKWNRYILLDYYSRIKQQINSIFCPVHLAIVVLERPFLALSIVRRQFTTDISVGAFLSLA